MLKLTKMVISTILWLGRGAATTMGLALMLALTVGLASSALAAVPGDPFKLGKLNSIDGISKLVGSASEAMLRINNNGSGPALDLRVEPGEAPMNVNSATQVNDLNADQLDGQSANDFISEDKTYTASASEVGSGGGTDVELSADCDSGDKILGGGGGGPFPPDLLRVSEPIGGDGWRVIAQDNGNGTVVLAKAVCADFPPLR
jgi:hypothetical protein